MSTPISSLAALVALLAVGGVSACGGSSSDGGGDGGATNQCTGQATNDTGQFISLCGNFQGFRNWTHSYQLPDDSNQGNVHLPGPKVEYLNMLPTAESLQTHTFPKGTIIVKELAVGAVETRKVFAMVKRGGGYNSSSSTPDWEWFELENRADGTVNRIIWHGFGPPAGEQYGGDPAGCSNCHHDTAPNNDGVPSAPLQLQNLVSP